MNTPHFTIAARNGDGTPSVWRLDTTQDIEVAREQVADAIAQEAPFKRPSVVLVGITGGKA